VIREKPLRSKSLCLNNKFTIKTVRSTRMKIFSDLYKTTRNFSSIYSLLRIQNGITTNSTTEGGSSTRSGKDGLPKLK